MGKKLFLILLIAALSFSIIFSTEFASAASGSYLIPSINTDIFIKDDGTVHVKEMIHYSSIESNVVYRDIIIKNPAKMENIKISTPGIYSRYEVTDGPSCKNITLYLYANSSKAPLSNGDADVIIEYDLLHVIKFYNDMAEFQYKLIGEEWSVNVGQLNSKIHLTSSEGVKYFLSPQENIANSTWQGNTLFITSKIIRPGRFFEITMFLPKNQFMKNPPHVIKINQDIAPEIEKIQNQSNFTTTVYVILAILMIFLCFIPLIIYLIYGKDPKIDYKAEYEYEVPVDDPPAVVNAICGKLLGKEVGKPDMDGFRATIMDLISRGYLILDNIPSKNILSESSKKTYIMDLNYREHLIEDNIPLKITKKIHSSISFRINKDKDLSKLLSFERDIIDFFTFFEEEDGSIRLERIKKEFSVVIKPDANSVMDDEIITFHAAYEKWKHDLINDFLDEEAMSEVFHKKGVKFLKIFGGAGILVASIVFFVAALNTLPVARYTFFSSIILLLVALTCLILPHRIAGHWTTYGEEYDMRWKNFAKYIHDYSLINEYPPESIELWDKYLVYACALGIAPKVSKSMELFPYEDGSEIYKFYYSGGYCELSKSLDKGIKSLDEGDDDTV